MKLLVINGPNLNLLGLREPAIYGSQNYEALLALIRTACDAEGIEVGFVQSNHEGTIVDAIQAAYGVYDGIIINPAAYTHTSIAILDGASRLCGGCEIFERLPQQVSKRAFRKEARFSAFRGALQPVGNPV